MLRHERPDALHFIFNLQERELVAQFASCRTGKKIAPKELFRPLRIVGLLSDRVHISRNVCESHTDYTFASDATWSEANVAS